MGISPGIGRSVGAAVDRARDQSRGHQSDRGDDPGGRSFGFERAIEKEIGAPQDFFGRQRQRQLEQAEPVPVDRSPSRGALAALVERKRGAPGFNMGQAQNPEMGGGDARASALEGVERDHGSFFGALGRGDLNAAIGIGERRVGGVLGIETSTAMSRRTGMTELAGTFKPISLLGNAVAGAGLLTAVQAARVLGPWSGASTALDAVGQRRTAQFVGGLAPTVSLGTQPLPGTVRRSRAKATAGAELSAVDQLALDWSERRDAAIAARERSRAAGRGDPQPQPLVQPLPLAPAPRPQTTTAAPPRGFGRLAGRDTRTDVDLLRTGEEAAIAAGLAPPRPRLGGVRPPARPGALI